MRAGSGPAGDQGRYRRLRSPLRRRRDRLTAALIAGASLITVVIILASGSSSGAHPGGGTSGGTGNGHTNSHAASAVEPSLRSFVPATMLLPGKPAKLPFPAKGQGAVGVAGVGLIGHSPKEHPVPIASVTKVMTAVVILKDHPLRGNEGGPVVTMTAADHNAWILASEEDHSNVEIIAGERLDERQMLEALLIPSADNIADILAKWDAGSEARFVGRMNAEAAALGLHDTHYADASGVDPASRSTAWDQVVLGGYAMSFAAIRSIAQLSYVDLPVSGRVWNYNPVVGVDGIVGLKSGFTQAAGGCLVTAAWRNVQGHQVLVVSAALDQYLGLYQAGQADIAMLNAAASELRATTLWRGGARIASAKAPWSHDSSAVMLGGTAGSAPVTLVGWPGLRISSSLREVAPAAGQAQHAWPEGSMIARLLVRVPGGVVTSVPAVLGATLPAAPAGWTAGSG